MQQCSFVMESLTPLHLRLLLHSHLSFEVYSPWTSTTEDYLKQLESLGAVERVEDSFTNYKTTKLGDAWLTAICSTPPPRLAFLDATGKEILV